MPNFFYRSQFNFSNSAKTVTLRAKISFDSSGVPTLVSGTGMGISSVSKTATGTMLINLSRSFGGLMMVNTRIVTATGLPAAPTVAVSSDAVSNVSAPSLTIVSSVGGIATNPAAADTMMLEIILNDSSLPY